MTFLVSLFQSTTKYNAYISAEVDFDESIHDIALTKSEIDDYIKQETLM